MQSILIFEIFVILGQSPRYIVTTSRLAQFWQDFAAKVLFLVNPTELEIIYQDFAAKVLFLVNPDPSTKRLSTV